MVEEIWKPYKGYEGFSETSLYFEIIFLKKQENALIWQTKDLILQQ